MVCVTDARRRGQIPRHLIQYGYDLHGNAVQILYHRNMLALILAIHTLSPLQQSLFHPGGKDASGCHTNRKTGDRHCHGGGFAPSKPVVRKAPAKVQSLRSSPALYSSCDDVRAAGAAPIRRGDPGYSGRLDRDGDGIACEAGAGGGTSSGMTTTRVRTSTYGGTLNGVTSGRPTSSSILTSSSAARTTPTSRTYAPATLISPVQPNGTRPRSAHHIRPDPDP